MAPAPDLSGCSLHTTLSVPMAHQERIPSMVETCPDPAMDSWLMLRESSPFLCMDDLCSGPGDRPCFLIPEDSVVLPAATNTGLQRSLSLEQQQVPSCSSLPDVFDGCAFITGPQDSLHEVLHCLAFNDENDDSCTGTDSDGDALCQLAVEGPRALVNPFQHRVFSASTTHTISTTAATRTLKSKAASSSKDKEVVAKMIPVAQMMVTSPLPEPTRPRPKHQMNMMVQLPEPQVSQPQPPTPVMSPALELSSASEDEHPASTSSVGATVTTAAQVHRTRTPSPVATSVAPASKRESSHGPAAHSHSGRGGNSTCKVVKTGGPCDHCGVTESPQWRRGPPSKPTLCNACGTRYRRTNQLGPSPAAKAERASQAAAAAAAATAHVVLQLPRKAVKRDAFSSPTAVSAQNAASVLTPEAAGPAMVGTKRSPRLAATAMAAAAAAAASNSSVVPCQA